MVEYFATLAVGMAIIGVLLYLLFILSGNKRKAAPPR
jgi:hypothetical protein